MWTKVKLAFGAAVLAVITFLKFRLDYVSNKRKEAEEDYERAQDDIRVRDKVIEVKDDAKKITDDNKLANDDDIRERLQKYTRD